MPPIRTAWSSSSSSPRWEEHLRQHERTTRRDADRLARIRAMSDPDHPAVVTHWITPPP
jgi:hypothetical protein